MLGVEKDFNRKQQGGCELRKCSQCGLIGAISVGYDATTTCGENFGGHNSINNGVMANILTTPQSHDSVAVTTKKWQWPKLELEQIWKRW